MNNEKIKKRLFDQSIQDDKWLKEANERQENAAWLDASAAIALNILTFLRENKITQKALSEQLGYSPQYVNKIVKGSENVKLEKVMGIQLISIVSSEKVKLNQESIGELTKEMAF
jgi:predicted XRE-type DNA-binding protein